MSATFKCILSGNTVTFEHQVDIDSMKNHPDYERVEAVDPVVVEEPKKAGRPKADAVRKTEAEVH
jgi:hypothetical protein